MNSKLIVLNWKTNPTSGSEAAKLGVKIKDLIKNKKNVEVVVCPPAPFIPLVMPKRKNKGLAVGAQDAFFVGSGSYTGRASSEMFKSLGCEYVIVGHSEKRQDGDTDEVVAKKVESVIRSNMKAIICVGEEIRDKEGKYLNLIRHQVISAISLVKKSYLKDVIIAYEPLWAIGKDAYKADDPESFFHNAVFIKKAFATVAGSEMAVKLPVLYGGSVTADNALKFLVSGRADGLLIGRASLLPEQVKDIIYMAEQLGNNK
ncbi:MAG TPA: triose-phosphate isomerase [Candidatus Paceibacterota bacterium]